MTSRLWLLTDALLLCGVALLSAIGGFKLAQSHYEQKINQQMEAQNAQLQEQNRKLREAQAKLDRALRDASALRATAARLRADAERRAATDSAGGNDRLAGCERLLGEGAELSARAVNLQP